MSLDIRLERHLPYPIERVWEVLTESEHLSAWLMHNDSVPLVGHRFRLSGEAVPGWRGWAECEVLELVPYRMVWAWWANDDVTETRVCFELSPTSLKNTQAQTTRLVLTHKGEESIVIARLLDLGWAARLPALTTRLAAMTGADLPA